MNSLFKGLCLGAATAAFVTIGVAAASEGDIAYRKATMESIANHLKSAVLIIKGQVDHKDDLKGHTHALAELAKVAGHIFPAGSGEGDTKALGAIWESPADFAKAVAGFQTATAMLNQAATAGDMKAAAAGVADVGNACKACHSKYKGK